MSDLPFGFGPGGPNDPDKPQGEPGHQGPQGPFGGSPFGGGPEDLLGKAPLFAELQRLLSWSGGPVNWDLARQTAIAQSAGESTAVTPADRSVVAEALRLAELWLDPATAFPSAVTSSEAWSRVDWIEKTVPGWSSLVEPVAARIVASMGESVPEEAKAQLGPMAGVLGTMGGLLFGAQLGQGLAGLSGEVLTSTDVGVPLTEPGRAAMVPANIAAFGAGLDQPDEEVRLFLALREAAHHRLYRHVPWLRGHVRSAVAAFADGIRIDTDALQRAAGSIDWSNPESLGEALQGGMLQPANTAGQEQALARLETTLALVEGWVDCVSAAAAQPYLSSAAPLREMLRRRRATGGPAEQTFASLVGLELRPRRLREAAALWQRLADERGTAGRDEVWAHPDLLPTGEDLGDPEAFVAGTGGFEVPDDASGVTDAHVSPEQGQSGEAHEQSGDAGSEDADEDTPDR